LTLYAKASMEIVVSKSDDYQHATPRIIESHEWSPGIVQLTDEVPVPVAPAHSDFIDGACTGTFVVNHDATNYVEVSYDDASGTSCVNRVPAGDFLYIPAVDGGGSVKLKISADTAPCICSILQLV
jgi:hypothetical protein